MINEFSVLMNILSQKRTSESIEIGATEDDLCNALAFTGKNRFIQLYSLLTQFNNAIAPFGLMVHQNPLNFSWFIRQDKQIEELLQTDPFEHSSRLAATLCVIISYCLTTGKPLSIQELQEFRGKKNVTSDLTDLINKNFIVLKDQAISLHPNLGYYLDLEDFLHFLEHEIGKKT